MIVSRLVIVYDSSLDRILLKLHELTPRYAPALRLASTLRYTIQTVVCMLDRERERALTERQEPLTTPNAAEDRTN